jgi:hypothetical protein
MEVPEDQNGLTTYVPQQDRYLVTAAANGRLEIAAQVMFDNGDGSLTEYKHCSGASANLMPSLAITKTKTGCMIHIAFSKFR